MIPFELTEPNKFDVADAEKFSQYSARINYCQKTEVYSKDGFRFYGCISVVHQDKEIVLNVFKHATEHDLTVLESYISKIQNGYWKSFPWESKKGSNGVQFDQVTLGTKGDAITLEIFPCTEQHCVSFGKYHLIEPTEFEYGPLHSADFQIGEKYRLTVLKAHGEEWTIDVWVGGSLTATDAASFTSDLAWLTAEVKNMNGVS